MRHKKIATVMTALLTATGLLVGCSSEKAPSTTASDSITVFAAASLRVPFEEIGVSFTKETGIEVEFNFGNSHTLALGIAEGNHADVFASADLAAMDDAKLEDFTNFTTNILTVAVRSGNPLGIDTVDELEQTPLSQCVETAPCGILARDFATSNNLNLSVKTEGTDVTNTMAPLLAGEVDAALVYATDAKGNKDTELVTIEGLTLPATAYAISAVSTTESAQKFLEGVLGEQGTTALTDYGFIKPPEKF